MKHQLILIEDDPIFTFLLEKAIKSSNIEGDITPFQDGLAALTHLKKVYNNQENYIIFLDLNMPVMNGWQFMESFNSIANPVNCIVFIVTSSNNPRDIEILMENPLVADFITKPITDTIISNIKNMISAKFEE